MTIPVLALHCSGSSGAQWRALAARLGPRYRVIAPDFAHCGSLSGEAGMLGRLGEPMHLVGHSYGGAVALHLARARPWLFRSLTLIEPSAFHLLQGGDRFDAAGLREISGVADQVNAALASGDHAGGYGRFVDYWSGPGSWAAMAPEKRAAFAPQLANVSRDFDALLGEPARMEDMKALSMPTLMVQGALTELPSRCICKRLRDAHPGWKSRVVQGAGHMLPLTHRDQVNNLIAEHIGGHSTAFQQEAA